MKTTVIRSISMTADIATWVEEQAAAENRSVSSFVNAILGRVRAGQIPVSDGSETDKVKEETL